MQFEKTFVNVQKLTLTPAFICKSCFEIVANDFIENYRLIKQLGLESYVICIISLFTKNRDEPQLRYMAAVKKMQDTASS